MKHDLWKVVTILRTDYSDYGGRIERWSQTDQAYPDCSCGCKHFLKLDEDWGVCAKPYSYRSGLLTYEHQAGYTCFEIKSKC